MIVDRFENRERLLRGYPWDVAFAYLQGLGPAAPEADTALDGEKVFGRVMAYATRRPEDGLLESHRKYVDIQTTLVGAEGIEWFSRASLAVREPYRAETDVELYHRPGTPPARIDVYPGTFCVFFPEDAHLAQQIVGEGPAPIRKAVVKIHVDLLKDGTQT